MKSRLEQGDTRFSRVDDFSICKSQKIVEINSMDKKETTQPLYDKIKSDNFIHCHYFESIYEEDFTVLDLMHENGSKGKAIKFLRSYTGAKKMICFGDNLNDLSMFEASDEKYAVANAYEIVKKNATEIIESNNDDGVAVFLKEYFNKE